MLTEAQISKLKKPGDYGAGGVPGFALRVYPSGKRSWLIRYRHSGRARRMVIADYPGLDLKEARKLAAETYGAICRDRVRKPNARPRARPERSPRRQSKIMRKRSSGDICASMRYRGPAPLPQQKRNAS